MSVLFDPRGDLSLPDIVPNKVYRRPDTLREQRRSIQNVPPTKRSHRRPCHDWIFSTCSNVHIAIDRTSFKTFTAFKTYVLAVSDHREIPVGGIGSVEINLNRSADTNEAHTITLDNVLYAPSWMTNIFSDVYLLGRPIEHTWTHDGIVFMRKYDDGKLRRWGFTEDFFGLEKLSVIGSKHGRSPMSEDKEREIFSVNVTWPQGQRDRWEAFGES